MTVTKPLALVAAGVVLAGVTLSLSAADTGAKTVVPPVLNFTMKKLDGTPVNLAEYQGKVVLFVNVASKCGYTPQYAGLQKLHEKYGKDGLAVVGVPANEFGKQEPGTDTEISEFCKKNYGVTFDVLSKVVVKGPGTCGLYEYLTTKEVDPKLNGPIGWNFEKFLVSRKGEVVGRYKSKVEPGSKELTEAIEAELMKK
jgi:glutathione peroxidase